VTAATDTARDRIKPVGTRVWNGEVRAAIVIVGGVLVLQTSDALTLPKVLYFVLAAVAVAGGLLAVLRARHGLSYVAMRGLLVASLIVMAVLALSLPVALLNGTPFVSWLRDSVSYGLFAVVAFMAFDAAFDPRVERSTKWILLLTIAVGALVTVSYTAEWLGRRDTIGLTIERLVLPSGAFASAFFVMTSAYSFRADRHRFLWALAAGLALGLFLLTGTRGRLPFFLLPILLAVLSRNRGLRVIGPSLLIHAAAVALIVIVTWGLPALRSPADPAGTAPTWAERTGTVDDLVTRPATDLSFQERVSQTVAAWQVFVRQPIVGTGPGHEIAWTDYAGETRREYNLDSPVVFLSKFGLLGAAAAAGWIFAFFMLVRRMRQHIGSTPEYLALFGFSIVMIYGALFSPPMQDKGFAFALILVLALALRRAFGPAGVSAPASHA